MNIKFVKSDSNHVIFKRDETNLKTANPIFVPILSISMSIMIVQIIVFIIMIMQGDYVKAGIASGIFILLLIFGMYCDTLNWFRNLEYSFFDNKLDYRYDLESSILPISNAKVHITINRIDKYEITSKFIIVYGEIIKKVPMQGPKTMKKFKFVNLSEYTTDICSCLDAMKFV